LRKEQIVVFAGIREMRLVLTLAFWKNKSTKIGWVVVLFFVLVFPENIAQYLEKKDAFGTLDSDKTRFIRLFFQPVLIALAFWSLVTEQS
jgi:uncharacterized membrane protein